MTTSISSPHIGRKPTPAVSAAVPATEEDFLLKSYDFALPPELIAQFPPQERGTSRLLVLPRRGAEDPVPSLQYDMFSHICDYLPENALLVANNSRVLQARLLGTRHTGGKVEFLLLTPLPLVVEQARVHEARGGDFSCAEVEGLLRAGGKVPDGETLTFGADMEVTVLEAGPFGHRKVLLSWRGDLAEAFAATGHMPLPPYIKRADTAVDHNRYQTVYARSDKTGSVAAPTAGLHFTPAIRDQIAARGYEWAEVTLYVGYGTFSPVRCEDVRQHKMHREYVEVPEATATAIARAKAVGRPVLAVGTTTTRTLEGVARLCGKVQAFSGWLDVFLYPGRPFTVVDALLTNFHLPQSTLLMMVSAFAGRERVLRTYAEAVRRGYRFFSYGDAMLIK